MAAFDLGPELNGLGDRYEFITEEVEGGRKFHLRLYGSPVTYAVFLGLIRDNREFLQKFIVSLL